MMRKLIHKAKYPALTFVLSYAVLFYFFHTVLLSPNDYLFASGGDGIKNYYTFLFHATHDTTFWEFTGMNYPYYENIVYTDAHPLLSHVIGFLGLENYGIGILNTLILLSFPLCSVFLFLILKHYKVELFWSIFAAIAITYMTPQIFRLTGHLSLSYIFAIPLMWWLLIKCNNARSASFWAIASFLYVMLFFFTHPYLGIIIAFLSVFFWLFVYLSNRTQWKTAIGFFTIQVIIPFTLFRLLIFATDSHYNRMDIPAGFYNLFGGWGSVLIPHHGPTSDFTRMLGMRLNTWESWAYIGLPTMIFFVIIVVYSILKRKEIAFKLIVKNELILFVFAAYAILIFSFCFPFKFSWMRWFGDYIGPLKQFRVLGRFAWIFYYVITISTIVGFYHLYKKQGKNLILGAVFFLGISYYFVESHQLISEISTTVSSHKNVFKEENLDNDLKAVIEHIEEEDYDAFIMLPFTHMSSENMMLLGEEKASFDAFMISYHSGSPMLNSVSSRLSQEESIKFNNFFGPEFCEKELIADLPKDAKIAIIINDDYLSKDELRMVYSHDYVYQNDVFSVCEFDRDAWNTDYYFNEVREKQKLATVDVGQDWKSADSSGWFYYQSWDNQKGESLKGGGSLSQQKMDYDELVLLNADSLSNGQYTISFWYNYYIDRADIMSMVEVEYNNGDEAEWVDTRDIKQSTHIVGHWMFVDMAFEITDDVKTVSILLAGNRSRELYIVDELLIRKTEDSDLFSTGQIAGKDYIIYNNYWIKADSFSE